MKIKKHEYCLLILLEKKPTFACNKFCTLSLLNEIVRHSNSTRWTSKHFEVGEFLPILLRN